jgi:hypothetical protein
LKRKSFPAIRATRIGSFLKKLPAKKIPETFRLDFFTFGKIKQRPFSEFSHEAKINLPR